MTRNQLWWLWCILTVAMGGLIGHFCRPSIWSFFLAILVGIGVSMATELIADYFELE